MNAALDWSLWRPFFITLAAGTALVYLAAWLAQRWVHSMSWRRTLWQTAFLALSLLITAEATGIGRTAWGWFRNRPEKPQATSVIVESKVIGEPDLRMQLAMQHRDVAPAAASLQPEPATDSPLWWLTAIWLVGLTTTLVWVTSVRLFFLIVVRRRTVQDETILARVDSISRRLDLPFRVRVTESRNLQGPIAHGMIWAGISLPEGFARSHSGEQQEAMLAHELAHLAARDPLWLTLSDLVMAVLWWHPLAWLAKRELRCATEAAADEASLVVENGATALAECLVELGGRLTRTRSLGWLGMAGGDFRSDLGKRVKRLVSLTDATWKPIRRSRLWLFRIVAPLLMVAMALATTVWAQPPNDGTGTVRQAFQRSILGIALTVAMPVPQSDIAPPTNVVEEVLAPPAPPKTNEYIVRDGDTLSRIVTRIREERGRMTQRQMMDANPSVEWTQLRIGQKVIIPSPSAPILDERRKTLNEKLDSILLEEISFDNEPLRLAVARLARLVKSLDPEGKGVNFIVSNEDAPPRHDPTTGLPVVADVDFKQTIIRLTPPLKGVTVREALNEMIRTASLPIIYQVEAYAVVFSPKDAERKALHTRSFKIDPATFERALVEQAKTSMDQAISDAISVPPVLTYSTGKVFTAQQNSSQMVLRDARRFFLKAGVDFSMPGRQMIYSDGKGYLMIRATLEELDIVEQAIQILNTPPPQIALEVKFCEVTAENARALGFDWLLGGAFTQMTNNSVSQKTNFQDTGILTEAQSRVVFQALEQRGLTNLLGAPKMILLSGRQGKFKNVRMRYLVTDLDWSYQATNSAGRTNDQIQGQPIAEPFELGPVLDVIPYALADGQTIQMTVIPSLTEFLGYDPQKQNRQETVTMPDGRKEIVTVPDQPLPIFRKLQMVSSAIVRDGQTVVLGGGSEQFLANPKRNTPLPEGTKIPGDSKTTGLLIFVTPTLMDAAGNRIHPSE